MAHFALINKDNIVTKVCKLSNDVIMNESGQEDEKLGIEFLNKVTPISKDQKWVQTSYNASFRGNYAGIGMRYDEELDMFLHEKPYESWILIDGKWEPPIERPEPNLDLGYAHHYEWDESQVNWELVRDPEVKPPEDPDDGYYWKLPEGEYDWVQEEIPPAPEYSPQPGFEHKFDHNMNIWVEVEIEEEVIEVSVSEESQNLINAGISTETV